MKKIIIIFLFTCLMHSQSEIDLNHEGSELSESESKKTFTLVGGLSISTTNVNESLPDNFEFNVLYDF